ncbi:DUF4225 domain-containing protein [Cronobacter sakazakii]|uniref:DUF4225 domain-containing protein n=1 Tax=Cronobacter sakazakii TaxID=28141 RepID=UPI0028954DAC|nr:DUF4225 domain-containing protein [Cronobacter sakazakii]MDT3595101.1 DUF4225 domain-containing protein [Cronobacter sakazakii]
MNHLDKKLDQLSFELRTLASTLSIKYFPDYRSRSVFLSEINSFIYEVSRDVQINCLSVRGAEQLFKDELQALNNQNYAISNEKAIFYAQIKKEKIDNIVNLILKQVGFVGGGTQIIAGYGVCAASVGSACAAFGSSLVAHGINNMYENGYYLLYRKDRPGFTRQGYRYVANKLGYSNKEADYAYAGIDLTLSAYGLGRNVLREDSYRLFRHVNTDFIRGWREMGKVSLVTEMGVDSTTLYGTYLLSQEGKK